MKKLLLFIVLFICTFASYSQTRVGQVISEAIALGEGASIPLPEGKWLVKSIQELPCYDMHCQMLGYLLENQQLNSPIPFVVFIHGRRSSLSLALRSGLVYDTDESALMKEMYGTLPFDRTTKISAVYTYKNISEYINESFMKLLGLDFSRIPDFDKGKYIRTYNTIIFPSEYIKINFFVRLPNEETVSNFVNINDQNYTNTQKIIKSLNSEIISKAEQSFFKKQPQSVIALNFNVHENSIAALNSNQSQNNNAINSNMLEEIKKKEELKIALENQLMIEEAKAKENARLAQESKAKEDARIAQEAKAKDDERIAQEAKTKEDARIAQEAKAKEDARLAQEAKAKEDARIAQEAKAKEDARIAQEAKAKEDARLAQEAKAKEIARLAQEAKAKEDARLAQEAKAKEDARIAQEAKTKESARLAQEAKAKDDARIAQEAKFSDASKFNKPSLEEQLAQLTAQLEKLKQEFTTTENGKPKLPSARKALVIGNNKYAKVSPLDNAVQDATAMAESLKLVGYTVTLKTNLTQKELLTSLRSFKNQVNSGDEVTMFYAGHGVQIGQTNYLLPIDISGESEDQIKDDSVQLDRFLEDMSEKKAKFTLAIVDACRDNPFKVAGRSVGGTRGLAPTSTANGQMIIFSAGAGQQALDYLGPNDKNKNGVFTRIFLQEMQIPGESIDKVVRNVRNKVAELAKSVNHDQVPAIYDQVIGEFYFKK